MIYMGFSKCKKFSDIMMVRLFYEVNRICGKFLCIWLLAMNLASAEKFSLDELSNYFNKLDTFKLIFVSFPMMVLKQRVLS